MKNKRHIIMISCWLINCVISIISIIINEKVGSNLRIGYITLGCSIFGLIDHILSLKIEKELKYK